MNGYDEIGRTEEFWGTREELLLACAVNRHGTKNWDSVALEVQKRIPSSFVVDPQTCKCRYYALQRRFTPEDRGGGDDSEREGGGMNVISFLEELRRLRVAELRREVESCDVSISSLQHKVKKLEEDRERSHGDEKSGDGRADPTQNGGREEANAPSTRPENQAVNRGGGGGDSGQSFNESNSSEAKDGRHAGVSVSQEDGAEKIDRRSGDEDKVEGEESYDGSSDTVAKETDIAVREEGQEIAHQADVGESGESVAETRGEAVKENSDVQSSATLYRRRRGRRRSVRGRSRARGDETSPGNTRSIAESQSLVSFLEIFRSHEYGSVFEQRLKIQESSRYRSLIRQHIEVAMVRRKLMEGGYAADAELYRDLLLLCTNAVIFFPNTSIEFVAAVELRRVVRKQIAASLHKPSSSSSTAGPAMLPPTESDPDLPDSPHDKLSPVAVPLAACRKRSSIASKEASKTESLKKEEESAENRRARERPVPAAMRRRRTSRGRGRSRGEPRNSTSRSAPPPPDDPPEPVKTERNATSGVPVVKRRSSATSGRTERSRALSDGGTLLETLKNSRKEARGDEGQKDPGAAPVKRGVGRPPKRPPAALTPPPAKRSKGGQSEAAPPPPRGTSRGRGGRKK